MLYQTQTTVLSGALFSVRALTLSYFPNVTDMIGKIYDLLFCIQRKR